MSIMSLKNESIMPMTLPVPTAEAPDDTEQVERLIHDTRLPLIFIQCLTKFSVLLTYDTDALINAIGEIGVLFFRLSDAFYEIHKKTIA